MNDENPFEQTLAVLTERSESIKSTSLIDYDNHLPRIQGDQAALKMMSAYVEHAPAQIHLRLVCGRRAEERSCSSLCLVVCIFF